MTPQVIIRNAIPSADDELCNHILWGRTPFPAGSITARDLYQAARRLDRATKNKKILCELCDRIAAENSYTCLHCDDVLSKLRNKGLK